MKKGLQLMSEIVGLARKAEKELADPEQKQAAVEIRLAAELVIESHKPNPAPARHHHRPD